MQFPLLGSHFGVLLKLPSGRQLQSVHPEGPKSQEVSSQASHCCPVTPGLHSHCPSSAHCCLTDPINGIFNISSYSYVYSLVKLSLSQAISHYSYLYYHTCNLHMALCPVHLLLLTCNDFPYNIHNAVLTGFHHNPSTLLRHRIPGRDPQRICTFLTTHCIRTLDKKCGSCKVKRNIKTCKNAKVYKFVDHLTLINT